MNYESIILELLSRVQELEKKVKQLQSNSENIVGESSDGKGLTERVREYIDSEKAKAKACGIKSLVLRAGDIQKIMAVQNRIVPVCNAMTQKMNEGDRILESPPSGFSTTLKIEYFV